METKILLQVGDLSDNGQVTIIDEDRLCYLVRSESKGAVGIRTISKALLKEFIQYIELHPYSNANQARDALSGTSDIDKFEYGYASTLTVLAKMAIKYNKVRKTTSLIPVIKLDQPHQQIYYGAPGTGKSHRIKENEDVKKADEKNLVFRTTFHPDSDYSTFVGSYKPSMKSSEKIYSPEELTIKLKEIKTTGTTYPCHKFATKYWESLKDLTPDSIKQILNACGFTDNYSVEISKGVAIGQEYLNNPEDGKIIYTFCPQAFTNAYIEAWNTEERVYLIIEEINRGNCAQIFGDLFQLLDRKNGMSEYPVDADADLQSYLNKALAKTSRTNIPDDVKSGKKLMLPSNLYIWATMNTSDQSLFPIDSAFKRRWNWKYIPIKNHAEKDYKIEIKEDNDKKQIYDWWGFLEKINQVIGTTTSSEDKKLGYFFCKAQNGIIDAETFVSKVLFYLWNDVLKNYGFDHAIFNKVEKEKITFSDFFDKNGDPEIKMVMRFLSNLDEAIDKDKSFKESQEETPEQPTAENQVSTESEA